MYNIMSICGSGICTSTLAAERLLEGLEENGILPSNINIYEANVTEASGQIENNPPDCIISTTGLDSVDLQGIQAYDAIPILMNNADELYENIAKYLKTLNK